MKGRKTAKIIAIFMAMITLVNASVVTSASLLNTEESVLVTLQGTLLATNDARLEGIWMRLYDVEEGGSEETIPLYEGLSKEDGTYEIKDIGVGNYRIAFAFDNATLIEGESQRDKFIAMNYQLSLADEEVDYVLHQVGETEGTDKDEADCFAYIESIRLEENTTVDLIFETLEAKEPASKGPLDGQVGTTTEPTKELVSEQTGEKIEVPADGVLTIADMKDNDPDPQKALATMNTGERPPDKPLISLFSLMEVNGVQGTDWFFDAYYVETDNKYYVEKNNDFSVKYQMEFHSNRNLPIRAVEIRIPMTLFNYRDGTVINPSDIAVPRVNDSSQSIEVANSPFNYYINGGELVFFNYRDIPSGSNAAFQVLYKDLKIMEIVDGTRWSLESTIMVDFEDGGITPTEIESTTSLRGLVDSEALLSSVTKTPLNYTSNSYTPALYTKNQVKRYIQKDIPAEYDNNFDNYRFVVWEVKMIGQATQPYDIYVRDLPKVGVTGGGLVGYRHAASDDHRSIMNPYPNMISGGDYDQYTQLLDDWKSPIIKRTIFVVTAYPKDQVNPGILLENMVDVIIHPIDNIDSDQKKSASAKWTWADYTWKYPPGNVIGIDKYVNSDDRRTRAYEGWLDVYKTAKDNGEDCGPIPFYTQTSFRGYDYTHNISGAQIGQPIPGRKGKVVTVDDFLYLLPNSNPNLHQILDDQDYYFSSVNISQRDYGYDVYEDARAQHDESKAGDVEIYAYFAGKNSWEFVATVPWSENVNGTVKYTFTPTQIARGPWRIKVEHETSNYLTECQIDVEFQARHNSPKFADMLRDYPDMTEFTVENISGVYGEYLENDVNTRYFQDTDYVDLGTGEEQELLDKTKLIYDNLIPIRDNAFFRGLNVAREAQAFKSGTTSNDTINGRVNVEYSLSAYDGYRIYNQEAADYIKAEGVELPGRNEVVFYDLLPHGVYFDPSKPIRAYRATAMNETGMREWNTTQMSVSVDPNQDIIGNYNGTGRTMVIFHVSYTGVDPSIYAYEHWFAGFRVTFGAYYDWKDIEIVEKSANIAAYMPAKGDLRPWLGTDEEVAKDDGIIVPATLYPDYQDFGSDINEDGITNIRNVLYAKAIVSENIVIASQSGINKLVRADDDTFGVYAKSAVVEKAKGYTYDVTVTNGNSVALENIVIYDRLENAAVDRQIQEPGIFEPSWWLGTYQGINTRPLELLGIAPVVYYNASRTAPISEIGTDTPMNVLTEANGWYKVSDWTRPLSDVLAVAIDISKKTDDTNFQLATGRSVSFQINMQAPNDVPPNTTYAYNNPSFYSHEVGTGTSKTVIGNSAKVRLAGANTLEVVKKIAGEEAPNAYTDWQFQFTAYQEGATKTPYRNKSYKFYKINENGDWEEQKGIYATDASGRFYLRSDEKAVFIGGMVVDLVIEEEDNPFWEQTIEMSTEEGIKTILFKNKYRPVLYASKILSHFPSSLADDVADDIFTFQILANDTPLANATYWLVDRAYTNGAIPVKLGEGTTDSQGRITIKVGDIIALFPGDVGTKYTIKEVAGAEPLDDWICKVPEISGNIPENGKHESITNIYKWKELFLIKNITHQDVSEVAPETNFTFQVQDANGNGLSTGNTYVVIKDGGEIARGQLSPQGYFTAACAGVVVRIEKLEAEKTYIVKETNSGALYEAVSGGMVQIKMPLYGTSTSAVITNDYLKRPILVKKLVSYNKGEPTAPQIENSLKTKKFHMFITVNNLALSDYPYVVTKNGVFVEDRETDSQGQFWLRADEIATFKDAGLKGDSFEVREQMDETYPQIYPNNQESNIGIITGEGPEVTFINGASQGQLIISKEYIGTDEAKEAYIEEMKNKPAIRANAAVTVNLEVTTHNDAYKWPENDTNVTVIDNWAGGSTTTEVWSAHSDFKLEPGKIVILPNMAEVQSYTLKESPGDQYRLYEYAKGKWLEVKVKEHPIAGTIEKAPVATLYNELVKIEFEGSQISKKMIYEAEEVPTGARLVWRLEKYDGVVWNPANDVEYVTFDDKGATTDRVLGTGSDGKITLTKTDDGYPIVKFLSVNVKLNLYTGMTTGDYRLVELLGESDAEWGYLAGYGKDNDDGTDLSPDDATHFINANVITPVEIEKKMETLSDEVFTMILKRVISTATTPALTKEDILVSEVAPNITYIIYDSATNQEMGTKVTTSKGEIFLKSGQYVRLQLPYNTLWTVSEDEKRPYFLKELSGSPTSKVAKLDDNLMLIYQQKAKIKETAITQEMVKNGGVIDAATGQAVSFVGNVTIPERIIYQGEQYLVTSIGTGAFKNNEAPYKNTELTGITFPDSLQRIEANAFEECVNLTGQLVLPKRLEYIGTSAFYYCSGLTGDLIIPDNVTELDEWVFYECTGFNGKLIIGEGVTNIKAGAFMSCTSLTGSLIIPENVKEIGNSAFGGCQGFNELKLPDTPVKIEEYVFEGLTGLTGVLVLPTWMTTISAGLFGSCSGITEVVLPTTLTEIGATAFERCTSLTGDLVLPASVNRIDDGAFHRTAIQTLKAGDVLTAIGAYAFRNCNNLTTVEIGSGISSIGNSAFGYCSSLTANSVKINRAPETVSGSPWGTKAENIQWTGTF